MDKISPFNLKKFQGQETKSEPKNTSSQDLPTRTYRSYETGERGLSIESSDLGAKARLS